MFHFLHPLVRLLYVYAIQCIKMCSTVSGSFNLNLAGLKLNLFLTPSICCKIVCVHGLPGYRGYTPPFLSQPKLIFSY